MKKASQNTESVEMRTEYDFSKAIRGKYAGRFANGFSVRILRDDGSAIIEKHGKDGKVTRRVVPAPPSKEIRVRIPIRMLARLEKLADDNGLSAKLFIREVIEDRLEAAASATRKNGQGGRRK